MAKLKAKDAERPVERRRPGRPATGPTKTRISFYIDPDLVERARNASHWASPHVPLNEIAERGIAIAVRDLEKKNGGPFPPRGEK